MTTTRPAVIRRTSRRGLHYGHDGTGPAVVLVHGWCLNRQVWMYLERALVTGGRTVITPDLAGYGESAGLAPRTSLADHAADLTDLLDELDVERAVLVGFAFGAGVICSAEDYRRVGALVSVAIPSAATAPYDRMRGSIGKDWPRFAARSAQAIVPEQASTETKDWLGRMFGATSLASALAGLDILRSFEPRDLVKRWDVPAYFVHGSGDPIVPAAISKECAEQFGGEYLEVSSAAHLVVIDQKEAVHRIVEDVVAAVLPDEGFPDRSRRGHAGFLARARFLLRLGAGQGDCSAPPAALLAGRDSTLPGGSGCDRATSHVMPADDSARRRSGTPSASGTSGNVAGVPDQDTAYE
jgi:pimeloyl-ACP methyl ester carboxylesterase